MEREDAKKWIQHHINITYYEDTDELLIALKMAIEALSEPEREKGTDFPQAEDIEPTVESFKCTMDNVDKLMSEEKGTEEINVLDTLNHTIENVRIKE